MTRQPRKRQTQIRDAPFHERQKQVRAPLSADLREEYGNRNVRVNAGDTVEVLRDDFAGEESEVTEVDLTGAVIYVDGIIVEKADGEEIPRPLQANSVRVTELNLEDDVREARLKEDNE